MASAPIIELDGLTKRFGDTVAVDSLSLSVRPGEVYGLLGPNGAGKTTTIQTMMDIVRPTSGTVRVFESDPTADVVDVHQRVGYLSDENAFVSSLSGRENLSYVADAKGTSEDLDRLLGLVGLGHAADRKASSYSTGMRRRLGVAVALVGEPELLLLDEPFNGVDPHGVKLIREIVEAERDRGATVLLSSHLLDQVGHLCDRIGVVADGRLVAEGTMPELQDKSGVRTTVEIRVAGDLDPIENEVTAVEGVECVDANESTVTATVDAPDRQPAVLRAIRNAGGTVERVNVDPPTVEDVFVSLTDPR